MRWRRKLFLFSVASAAAVMGLLLTGVLAAHLLANREVVRSLVAAQAAQATGGKLSYDRLTVAFLPYPHLQAEGINLHRTNRFDINAAELAVYPRLWPLLTGRVSIRRLVLKAPDIQLAVGSGARAGKNGAPAADVAPLPLEKTIPMAVDGLFGALAAVESGTDVLIQGGTLTLVFADAPDLRITALHLYGENDGGDLSLHLECRSTLVGRLELRLQADSAKATARGGITASELNLRPILHYASLPAGILTENTQARFEAAFTIENPQQVSSRFSIRFPNLKIMRKGLKLDLDSAFISGGLDAGANGLTLSVDTLRAARPALDLSAGVRILTDEKTGRPVIVVHAAARQLDLALAGRVTRAIAGDLAEIRTAFGVAKAGRLTGVTYDARVEATASGYHLTQIKAVGHIAEGRLTIPGIAADLERVDGDIVYRNHQVTFGDVSGYFQGTTFKELNAAIDWAAAPSLSIASTAVHVEAKPFSDWLLSFKKLASVRETIQSIDGSADLSLLNIAGPLTDPSAWKFNIHGTPENIQLASPLVPYTTCISGGEIVYTPENQQATHVDLTFLDSSMVASFQSTGLMNPTSIQCQLDGSMGSQAINWLSTILPIPEHLQMKPPVDLAGVSIRWDDTGETSFAGTVKTAGGVELYADASILPKTWQIRRIQFSDGISQAVVSARKEAERIELAFSGHVEKATVDRMLETNHTLAGRLDGDFSAIIDTRRPLNSAFSGHISGQGLRIHQLFSDPVEVQRFSIEASVGRLIIAPSEIQLQGSRLVVDGSLRNHSGDIGFDLNVDADRLDAGMIRAIRSTGNGKIGHGENQEASAGPTLHGALHIRADAFTYENWTWSPVKANVQVAPQTIRVQINRADLCGIATTGELDFSSRGIGLHLLPRAQAASLEETAACLWHKPIEAQARYDLAGEIRLPTTTDDPLQRMTGHLDLVSQNGRIDYSGVLMKIFAVLNVTEIFTGGSSDLTEKGYGYSTAQVKSRIEGGKLLLDEILLDGNSLKITGKGSIDLKSREVDVSLLAAPLKTVDRLVNKLPVISYIAGGSLISIPLRVTGKLDSVAVATMPPEAVGKGLLNIMGRTLKAPFKLVQQAASLATGGTAESKQKPDEAAPQSQ